jgi:hypothetical protein
MNAIPTAPWEALFPAPSRAEDSVELRFRLVRKGAQPLLLLPASGIGLGAALALYPAQTCKAKLARLLLGACLRVGIPFGTEAVTVRGDRQVAFWRFLFQGTSPRAESSFALLCGNLRVPGWRFIVLVFDRFGQPARLVKTGVGELAAARTRAEAAFLKSVNPEEVSAPAVLDFFRDGNIEALALPYAPGSNPDPEDIGSLAGLLGTWLRSNQTMRLTDLPAWQRLAAVAHTNPRFRVLQSALESVQCHPAIFHGDFAPWNVRVNPKTKRWTVLDWERGELFGPPGWDWFHFFIQTATLVRRARSETIVAGAEKLLAGPEFRRYASAARIEDCARFLFVAYLLYCVEVMPPAEGAQTGRDLLNTFAQRWLPG